MFFLRCPNCGEQIDDNNCISCPHCSKPFQKRKRWEDFTKKFKAPFQKALAIFIIALTLGGGGILGGGTYKPPVSQPPQLVCQLELQSEQKQDSELQQLTQVNIEIETQDLSLKEDIASISGEKIIISEGIEIKFEQPTASESSDSYLINVVVYFAEHVITPIGVALAVDMLKKKLQKRESVVRIEGKPVRMDEEEFKQSLLMELWVQQSQLTSSSTAKDYVV